MKGLEVVKCESLQINMFRIKHTGKISKFSRNTFRYKMQTADWVQNARLLHKLLGYLSKVAPKKNY